MATREVRVCNYYQHEVIRANTQKLFLINLLQNIFDCLLNRELNIVLEKMHFLRPSVNNLVFEIKMCLGSLANLFLINISYGWCKSNAMNKGYLIIDLLLTFIISLFFLILILV